jgi:hypothetical protein
MATVPSTAASQRSFDDRGQAIRLTEDEIRQRNALALAALEAVEEIGDDAEQRETLDHLIRVVDEDRLSDRLRLVSLDLMLRGFFSAGGQLTDLIPPTGIRGS